MCTASAKVIIGNELGLHARPAMAFCEVAQQHACEVSVRRSDSGTQVDGKALMPLLTLALTPGTEIQIHARGADAVQAVRALVGLVESRFGEP